MQQHLILNIGNTHVQMAELKQGQPVLIRRFNTQDIIDTPAIIRDACGSTRPITASCVVPKLQYRLQAKLERQIRFLTHEDFTQLDFSLVDTSTMGVDRICNAAAILAYNGTGPVAVFDCGTCLASVVIDAQNRFRGGTIAPGRQLLRRALNDHTGQLPLVPIAQTRPEHTIGTDTADAIRAGVDIGAIGTLNFLVQQTRLDLQAPDCPIYLTGGDAPYFLNELPDVKPAPDLLTLRGIATTLN